MRYYVVIKQGSGKAGIMLSGDGNSCKAGKSKSGVCEPRSEIVGGNDVASSPIACEAGVVLSGDGSSCKSDKTKSVVCEPCSEIVGDNDVANSPIACEPRSETVCNDDMADNSIVREPHSDTGDDNVLNVHSDVCIVDNEVLQATADELKLWQQKDDNLREVRRVATLKEVQSTNHGSATFFYRDGILYRKWVPRKLKNQDLRTCEQLALPLCCRAVVMQIGHDTPMAGHLGVNKTRNRILSRYYRRGIFNGVLELARFYLN